MLQFKWFWAALVFCSLFLCGLAVNCIPGLNTPGVTIPKGDIILEYGDPLEIFCILNTSHHMAVGKNSSHLVFYHNDKLVLPEFVQVVNSTTIRFYVAKPPPSSSMYYCKLQSDTPDRLPEQAVCLNSVAIAFKPTEVINFTCISHNWENLTCSWIKPVNYINTSYSVDFKLPGRAGRRITYGCPNGLDVRESRCFWDLATNPLYRQPYEYYYFNMTGENKLGSVNFSHFKFHHYSPVMPAPPLNLAIVNKTADSVCLKWTVPNPMTIFPPGIIHKVKYQSQWDSNDTWREENPMKTKAQSPELIVSGLKYAYTLYDIKVYLKSAAASVGGDWWSIPANVTVRTLPTVPGSAPKTDIGSFEVTGGLSSRDIYIYWQQIPTALQNGEDFKYKVYKLDEYGGEHAVEPQESSNAYAKFKGMGLNSHKFVIVSFNKEGRSHNQSVIHIPGSLDSPPEPVSFTKIAFGNGTYELSWKVPPHCNNIVNFTIFWCNNVRDRPYQCTGFLEWVHVPKNVTVKRIDLPNDIVYQFAISANTKDGSSGMVWALCTIIHDKIVGKMKNIWINHITSRTIEVGWKLDCSDRVGMVTGYRISYCPIVEPKSSKCKEPFLNTTISGDATTIRGKVTGLKPYTTYMVSVAVVTKNGGGLLSDPLRNTTLEAAPDTPPSMLTVTEITNSSMVLDWDAPLVSNGHLRYYNVNINSEQPVKVDSDKRHVHLTNLSSYTNYTITVVACTVECSERSQNVTVRTAIGMPGEVQQPMVSLVTNNHSQLHLEWLPPVHSAKGLTFYELLVREQDKNGDYLPDAVYNVSDNKALIPIDCQAEGAGRVYEFAVRGVNMNAESCVFAGPWSVVANFTCYGEGLSPHVEVVIWICAFVVFIALCLVLGYVGKRLWLRCKMMQDVEVKLPPGLTFIVEKDSDSLEPNWPMSENRDPHKTCPSADEELLLHKKCGDGVGSGGDDSSGCSSGHESVSSSLTAGTHMSSDSGTEVDQRAASPDGVFSECCAHRQGEPYVRLGKMSSGSVARSTPNLSELDAEGCGNGLAGTGWSSSTGYISMQGSNEDMQASEPGYCRVGLDPQPVNKGYVSIASMPTAPSGYVAHSAYVPNTSPLSSPDPYCRMGMTTPGYVPLEGPRTGGYVPHGKFDKQDDLYTSVFAPVSSDPHIKSPTTSV